MSTSAFSQVANVAHKGFVLGLFTFFGFQTYQISKNVWRGRVHHPTMDSTYFQDVQEKIKEEYERKDNQIDKRDWYASDDDSYLKNQVRADLPKGSKQERKS
jgi:hypothetical protein